MAVEEKYGCCSDPNIESSFKTWNTGVDVSEQMKQSWADKTWIIYGISYIGKVNQKREIYFISINNLQHILEVLCICPA